MRPLPIRSFEKPKDVLLYLARLYQRNPKRWVKGILGQNNVERSVDPRHSSAVTCCLLGGLMRYSLDDVILNKSTKILNINIVNWNDNQTSVQPVINLLKKVAATLE